MYHLSLLIFIFLYDFLFKINYLLIIIVSRQIDLSIWLFTRHMLPMWLFLYSTYIYTFMQKCNESIFFYEVGRNIKNIFYLLFPKIYYEYVFMYANIDLGNSPT